MASYCYLYDYTAIDNCYTVYDYYPDCLYYYTDGSCCTSLVSWEYQYLGCLSSAYGTNCYNYYSDYIGYLTDYPCYSNVQSPTAPISVTAATTPVPDLSLIQVSYAVVTTTSTHAPVPTYSGGGNLLQGYCATPDYVLLDDPTTAYWAPVVGCATGKTDCCPYSVAPATPGATVTVDVTTTAVENTAPAGLPGFSGLQGYPTPANNAQATLANCPKDYNFVSGGCCPSGYSLWNVPLGGQVPCYSSLTNFDNPPPIPISANQAAPSITAAATTTTSSTTSSGGKPTSAVLNVVFAVKFPAQPPSSGLSTGAKAGIGAGAGVASIAIIALSFLLFRSRRKNRKIQNTPLPGNSQNPPMVQNQTDASKIPPTSMMPVPANTQPQFQAPASEGGYFPPQQQQVLPQVQPYYAPASQPGQHPPQQYQSSVQGQSLVSYPSPPLSTASPPPQSDGGYSYQASYGSQVPLGQVSQYSGSQDPRVSYPGGMTMQQGSQSWGQGYQQSAYESSASQQAPQELGQESQQSQMAPAGTTQYLGSPGNPPELQGYQIATHMSVPTQQQIQTLEQHSSQEQEQTQTFVEHRLVTSSDIDSVSAPLQQSPQSPTTSSVIRRPVPERAPDPQELGGKESGE